LADTLEIKAREQFDIAINEKLCESAKPTDLSEEKLDAETPHYLPYEDNDGDGPVVQPNREDLEDDVYDQYINSEVLLPTNGVFQTGKVVNRKRDAEGNAIGRAHKHAACDTREYIVQFPDGAEAE
jgi:hypothetical protein